MSAMNLKDKLSLETVEGRNPTTSRSFGRRAPGAEKLWANRGRAALASAACRATGVAASNPIACCTQLLPRKSFSNY